MAPSKCAWLILATAFLPIAIAQTNQTDLEYYAAEVDYIAGLKSHLTGSPNHNQKIDRIQSQLEALGLQVQSDSINFTYYDGPFTPPQLSIDGSNVPVSSYLTYSGVTGSAGIEGQLVDLLTSSLSKRPAFHEAKGRIAVTNITNIPTNLPSLLSVWPGSPAWDVEFGIPDTTAEAIIGNLSDAYKAGVKGVVYVWDNVTTGLVEGMYSPFHMLYQGVPAIFVGDSKAADAVIRAARNGSSARLVLEGNMVPNTPTRTIWTVFEGTDLKNESMIISTHTDGVNAVEENGYIALYQKAKDLVANPPRRTTILVWVTGHMHYEAFSPAPGKATSRWMNDHPELWTAQSPLEPKGVAASCVEHLGAVYFEQELSSNSYSPTTSQNPEALYASTSEMNSLVRQHWHGAMPNLTRVINPTEGKSIQLGEGYPFFLADIPNISLVTFPSYLLKIFPKDFNETQIIDINAMKRQVDSFMTLWKIMDGMPSEALGKISTNGTNVPGTYP